MSKKLKRKLILYGSFTAVLLIVYFGNVAIQTHLGKKALDATGLDYVDLETALTLAANQSKPILADLSAIWCPSCRKLDNQVFANAQVKQLINDEFIMARIEYESDAGKAFMKKYDVSGFPVLLVLNSQGEKIQQLPITFEPTEFVELLSQHKASAL